MGDTFFSNATLAHKLLEKLITLGVEDLILGSGARNTPLIYALDDFSSFKKYFIFEERSAAFFALGRSQATARPVAILTTSGTAAAELLPATIEAFYTNTPLILITADRPKTFRGTGAPQSIEQIGLFSHYIEQTLDLDGEIKSNSVKPEFSISLKEWSQQKPLHINICFQEPLINTPEFINIPPSFTMPSENTSLNPTVILSEFILKENPLILVASLRKKDQLEVLEFLKNLGQPLYLESSSGLKNHPELKEQTVLSGESYLNTLLENKTIKAVLRIGGVPTARLWRDLEDRWKELPVLSISPLSFLGTPRNHPLLPMEVLQKISLVNTSFERALDIKIPPTWKVQDEKRWLEIQNLFEEYPNSEPAFIYQLSKVTHKNRLYLGNSLPIREWDLFADPTCYSDQVYSNRGANGIDGQLSSFLGMASTSAPTQAPQKSWGVFGDLTTLYDLSAPFILQQLSKTLFTFVIMNNQGGKIFQRLFAREDLLNRHSIDFQHWAKLWNLSYNCLLSSKDLLKAKDCQVLELRPVESETLSFWQRYEKI